MDTPPTQPAPAVAGPSPQPAAPTARPPAGWWPSLLVAAALVVFFGPAYALHGRHSADPAWFNDDARQQIWPLLRYHDDRLFQNDVAADYYLSCFPVGFRTLYAVLAPVWDARAVSKVLPYLLLAVTAWAAGQAARRLRGPAAGWAAVGLCLGAEIYLARLAGGLPRSFAFPLLAVALLALARGKPILLAVVTVLGAAFYPAASVVTGLALAGWLLLPAKWLGKAEEWGWGRRLTVLGVAAALTVLVALPALLASSDYGPTLSPAQAGDYPELSAAGRYSGEDRADDAFSLRALKNFVDAPLAGLGGQWDPAHPSLRFKPRQVALLLMALAGIAGYVSLVKASPPGRRVLLLPAAALVAYAVSVPLVPMLYLPSRYQLYPLAIAALVIVPAGLAHLATVVYGMVNQRRTQAVALAGTVGPYLLVFSAWNLGIGGQPAGVSDLAVAGLERQVSAADAPLYGAIETLRPRAVLAGWPPDMDNVPYVTGRGVLLTREGHQSFHKRYADLMRQRMDALTRALYGTNPAALVVLREQYRVTHLVASKRLYGPTPPAYFAPFDAALARAREALGQARPTPVSDFVRPAVVFEDEQWLIVDLEHPRLKTREGAE